MLWWLSDISLWFWNHTQCLVGGASSYFYCN